MATPGGSPALQRPSDLGCPGSASQPGLGLGWLNNRCPSPRAGPVSLPPLVPPSRALAIVLDPGPLLVQPVSTFPTPWRRRGCRTVAPALPVCFCRCPQSWAEPRRPSTCSAPLLRPSLPRMGHSPLSPILGGHLLACAQPSTRRGPPSGCPPPAVGLGGTQNELCASSFPAVQGPHCRREAGEPTHVSLTALGVLEPPPRSQLQLASGCLQGVGGGGGREERRAGRGGSLCQWVG